MRWLQRFGCCLAAVSVVFMMLPEFVGTASATTGTGSCTVNVSGSLTYAPPHASEGASLSGNISCSGLSNPSGMNQLFVAGMVGSYQLFWYIGAGYSGTLPSSISCIWSLGHDTAAPSTPCNETAVNDNGPALTANNGSGWPGVGCNYSGNVVCGENNSGESWHGGVALTFNSTISGYSSPCGSPTSVSGSTYVSSDGVTAYPFRVAWGGSAATYIVALDSSAPSSGGTTTIDTHVFYTDQIMYRAGGPFGGSYGGSSFNTSWTETPPVGDPVNPMIYCDSGGTWTNWGLTTAITGYAACTLIWMSGYPGAGAASASAALESWPFTVHYGGEVDNIVEIDGYASASGATTTIDGKAFYQSQLEQQTIGSGSASESSWATSYSPAAGEQINPTFWCDSLGTWTSWGQSSAAPASAPKPPTAPGTGSGAGGTVATGGGAFDLATCFTSVAMTLYNPVTWVTGTVQFMVCGLRWLFQPSTTMVTAIENQFALSNTPACTGGGAVAATEWFGCMSQGLLIAPAADVTTMKTAADGGSCSSVAGAGTTLTVAGVSLSGCALVADTSSSYFGSGANSLLVFFALLLTAAVYVLCGLALFHVLKRTIQGNS